MNSSRSRFRAMRLMAAAVTVAIGLGYVALMRAGTLGWLYTYFR